MEVIKLDPATNRTGDVWHLRLSEDFLGMSYGFRVGGPWAPVQGHRFNSEGTDHFWCGARDQGDVWFVDKPLKNELHPTMKPVALVEWAIRNSSKSHDLVLELFGGSGTTLIAAEQAGRRARLVELDPKYVDVIVTMAGPDGTKRKAR